MFNITSTNLTKTWTPRQQGVNHQLPSNLWQFPSKGLAGHPPLPPPPPYEKLQIEFTMIYDLIYDMIDDMIDDMIYDMIYDMI